MTRRDVLAGALGAALAGAGVYELIDRVAGPAVRTAPPASAEAAATRGASEQHLLEDTVVERAGARLVVPPLHHALVTAMVAADGDRASLLRAQASLEEALRRLERRFQPRPSGLGITVAWGLPYFRRYVAEPAARHLPRDRRASRSQSRPVPALLDAVRFRSDPARMILEQNDAAVLLRSDSRAHVGVALERLFGELDVFEVTSIRRGFTGGAAREGETGLPKRMAVAAGIPGGELMPADAQLFFGFTSTIEDTLGRGAIANLETLGYSDGGPEGYFLRGTTMHVSHLFLDLARWYRSLSDADRATRMIGHSLSAMSASRLSRRHVAADGTAFRAGTAVPHRADFNTLDNPFFWSVNPRRDRFSRSPAAGMHFVAFHPTSDDFHRTRRAMDRGRRPGLAQVIRATHRQNFLVPPREHRSFPLVELLG